MLFKAVISRLVWTWQDIRCGSVFLRPLNDKRINLFFVHYFPPPLHNNRETTDYSFSSILFGLGPLCFGALEGTACQIGQGEPNNSHSSNVSQWKAANLQIVEKLQWPHGWVLIHRRFISCLQWRLVTLGASYRPSPNEKLTKTFIQNIPNNTLITKHK